MKVKNKAAQELGRLGGKVKSQAKTEAARLNAGKPRKPVFGTEPRIEGEWYWVTHGRWIWPAVSRKTAAGGWTTEDSWEDYDHEVIAWVLILRPLLSRLHNESQNT